MKYLHLFQKLRNHLKQSSVAKPWLIHFVDQTNDDKDLDLRKLPSMLIGKYYLERSYCDF